MTNITKHISKSLLKRRNPHGGYRKWLRTRHHIRQERSRM